VSPTAYSLVFALAVAIAYRMASDKDKPVWSVLLGFGVISSVLNVALWDRIDHPLEHLGFATIEAATIFVMLNRAPTRLGIFMSICLFWAFFVNFGLYLDLTQGTNLFYDRYESLLAAIAIGQLIPFAHGILGKAGANIRQFMANRRIRSQRALSGMAYSGVDLQSREIEEHYR